MAFRSFVIQTVPKHVAIVLLLLLFISPRVKMLIGALTPQHDAPTLSLVLTTAGLVLAGAIAGFTRLTFEGLRNIPWPALGLWLAHLTTTLQLLVIGTLLLVAVSALGKYSITTELGHAPLFVAVLLYASLVTYDLYDVMRQWPRPR